MPIAIPEVKKLNNVPPPADFKMKGAWKVKERFLISLAKTVPSEVPAVDESTQYQEAPGNARYLVENENFNGGGMSDVFRGWDSRMGKYVAVKKLKKDFVEDIDFKHFIELEAKTIARISHPGIPEVYDFNIARTPDGVNSPIMIMELLKSDNLDSRLKDNEKEPLTVEEISRIITQTADTVDFMNKKGITHSDIKPLNIILSKPHIKMIDFGSSNWVDKEGSTFPPYFTPWEAFTNVKDARTDEFSLAATAYNIFFKELLPRAFGDLNDIGSEIKNLLNKEPQRYPLSKNNKEKLLAVFVKAFAEKPNDRYQTSSEFAREFCSIIANQRDQRGSDPQPLP